MAITMDTKFTKEIYDQLVKAVDELPEQATETAKKEITRKGYDTTGYQYQFLVNVLNEVLTPAGWSFDYAILKELEGKWSTGKQFWDITVEMTVDILGVKRTCVGGHKAEMYSDATKGAITNALKKTLGLFGIGKRAYEGTIDEDYRPVPTGTASQPEKASQGQIDTLDDLIIRTGADEQKLLAYYKVKTTKDLTANQATVAINTLKERDK